MSVRAPHCNWHPIGRVEHGPRDVTHGVVIHDIEGSATGAIAWFSNPAAGGVGAHIVIDARGRAWQLADLSEKCWHAVAANAFAIGIEHEGFSSDSRARWYSRVRQLRRSAKLTAWICHHYGLGRPLWGHNLWGHVDGGSAWGGHNDPGRGFPRRWYAKHARKQYRRMERRA